MKKRAVVSSEETKKRVNVLALCVTDESAVQPTPYSALIHYVLGTGLDTLRVGLYGIGNGVETNGRFKRAFNIGLDSYLKHCADFPYKFDCVLNEGCSGPHDRNDFAEFAYLHLPHRGIYIEQVQTTKDRVIEDRFEKYPPGTIAPFPIKDVLPATLIRFQTTSQLFKLRECVLFTPGKRMGEYFPGVYGIWTRRT